jgi:UDPglucose 6-dehydrogenase
MPTIAVAGMWHLGAVTAACLASAGHIVVGIDEDAHVIDELKQGRPPIAEPGLNELTKREVDAGRLRFTTSVDEASQADIVWVAYDTPVDAEDRADVEFVHERALRLADVMKDGTVMVVSSQLPVGSVARLEREFAPLAKGRRIGFACIPENLRLGKAIEIFLQPDRVVAGVRNPETRALIEAVYRPFTDRIEWMSVESAEMTKHAINAFLASSICFINEIATVCEVSGADAVEVERGLKTDLRIGSRAYLHAGGAFAGGTLARDIVFLKALAGSKASRLPLIEGVHASNQQHKSWLERKMRETLAPLAGRTVAILGLAYKPGTNTLRRSSAIEASRWLASQGVRVRGFDPQIQALPAELEPILTLGDDLAETVSGADALVVMTPWPEFHSLDPGLAPRVVFDPARFLETALSRREGCQYYSIGRVS